MATTNLGRIAIIPKGDFVSGTTYKKLDVVRFGTGSFICLNLTTADPTNTTDWQLLASDGPQGVAGAGASNFTTQSKMFSFVGSLVPTIGTARFYPPQSITLSSAYLSIGTPSITPVTVVLRKNGSTELATITLSANSLRTTEAALSSVITKNDFLTVDLSTSGGDNLNLTLVYS